MSWKSIRRSRTHHVLAGLALSGLVACGAMEEEGAPDSFTDTQRHAITAEPVWRYTQPPAQRRVNPAAVRLPSGKVLMAGGYVNASGLPPLVSAELYHPETDSWTSTGSMSVGRYGAAVVLLPNGKVLVSGGRLSHTGSMEVYTKQAELYDPSTGSWTPVAAMNQVRAFHALTVLSDGKVLAVGTSNTSEIYDPVANTWTNVPQYFNGTKFSPEAIPLQNGKVLMVCNEWRELPQLFTPATRAWAPTGAMSTLRQSCAATRLSDGRVLVMGGYHSDTDSNVGLATAELYNPATNTWTPVAPMQQGRFDHESALLPDGRVLVAGGWANRSGPALASTEVYDPATNTWQPTTAMNWSRVGGYGWEFINLPSGQLFVADGSPELYLSEAPPSQDDLGSVTGTSVAQGNTCGRPNSVSPSCGSSNAPDHAYTWTAPSSGTFTFSTTGSSYDTVLQVKDFTTGASLGCNDDSGNTLQSSVAVSLTAGQKVLIAVDGFSSSCGAFTLNIQGASNLNLALGAATSASSTYCSSTTSPTHCYSPGRINDGDRNTTVGGQYSWSNDLGPALPQWVELNFGSPRTFARVELYTSSGYAIQDYSLEIWNGSAWVAVSTVQGNTAIQRTHTFTPVTASKLRVLGRKGPTVQLQHVRVNELEVYAN